MEENKTILKEEGEEKVEEKTQKIEDEGKIEPEEEIQEKNFRFKEMFGNKKGKG